MALAASRRLCQPNCRTQALNGDKQRSLSLSQKSEHNKSPAAELRVGVTFKVQLVFSTILGGRGGALIWGLNQGRGAYMYLYI